MHLGQGCQMVSFQTQNPNLGKFCRVSEWKRLLFSLAIWNTLQPFGNLLAIWYIFLSFGILFQEKSGNPDLGCRKSLVSHFSKSALVNRQIGSTQRDFPRDRDCLSL
jgi:hypothetical protein